MKSIWRPQKWVEGELGGPQSHMDAMAKRQKSLLQLEIKL
jgi:hypothetical protein